jgi:hypothetical protein
MVPTTVHERSKEAHIQRLEAIGWGLFLIMTGAVWLIPGWHIPVSLWLIATGFILLGVNAVRYLYGIKMNWASLLLGLLTVLFGVGELVGLDLPLVAILLIVFGLGIILRPWLDRLLEPKQS